jgi:hypothetical protein
MNAEDRELFDGMTKLATFYRDIAIASLEKIERATNWVIAQRDGELGPSQIWKDGLVSLLAILQEENE